MLPIPQKISPPSTPHRQLKLFTESQLSGWSFACWMDSIALHPGISQKTAGIWEKSHSNEHEVTFNAITIGLWSKNMIFKSECSKVPMAQQKIWESHSVAISHLLHLVELLLPAEVFPVVSLLGSFGKCRKNASTSKHLPSKTHLVATF